MSWLASSIAGPFEWPEHAVVDDDLHTHFHCTNLRQRLLLGYRLQSRVCERFRFNRSHASGLL